MAISRGELRGQVLRFLNKSADNSGFYDEHKVNDAITEALNFISVEMFLAGEGWLTSYQYFDTESGQTTVDIPGNIALIREVRYKISDVYASLPYNDQSGGFSYVGTGVQQALGYCYRLLGRQILFDPPLSEGGERYLQVEAVSYPTMLLDDNEIIDPQFDAACCTFLKYKVASILSSSIEKDFIAWAKIEAEWEEKMKAVVTRRTLASTPIREFL
jgi:hypothetical protein